MKKLKFCTLVLAVYYSAAALFTIAALQLGAKEITAASYAADLTADIIYIVDAGHGGEDGGAVSDSGVLESDINLSIAKKLELVFRFIGERTIMTRTSDIIEYPKDALTIRERKRADLQARSELANSVPNAVLISIHQNKFSSPKPYGAQVLYNDKAASLATLLQSELIRILDPSNYRSAEKASDDIYLMKNSTCPAMLIECGFISNPNDLSKLLSNDYQLKLAALIAAVTTSNRDILTIPGGTNETENSVLLH